MPDADSTHASATAPADEHQAEHDHESSAEPLGAPDMGAWGMAIAGGAIGLIVALALFVASQG